MIIEGGGFEDSIEPLSVSGGITRVGIIEEGEKSEKRGRWEGGRRRVGG